MTQFAVVNTTTNVCENVIVADTFEIANTATPAHCTPVECFAPRTNLIGLVYDWNKKIFIDPQLASEE